MDDLPLLDLFVRLREVGIPLDVDDYEALIRAIEHGYGLPDRNALAHLCQTLWVRSSEEQQKFDYYFEQFIRDLPTKKQSSSHRVTWLRWATLTTVVLACGILLQVVWVSNHPTQQPEPPQAASSPGLTLSPSPSPVPSVQPQKVSNSMIWAIVLSSAIGGGMLGLIVLLLLLRQQKVQVSQPPTRDKSMPKPPELFKPNQEAEQLVQAIEQLARQEIRSGISPIPPVIDYLPVTQRQMKQSWRYLRRMVREGVPTELDLDTTVKQIGRDGFLIEPVMVPRRVNWTELLLLFDCGGSMVPFQSLSKRLLETAIRGGRLGKVMPYYFHNCPIGNLHKDPGRVEAESVELVFSRLCQGRTLVLIFSDAGSAKGGMVSERVEQTTSFLAMLRQYSQYVVWLNPMPQERWLGTTAGEIAQLVPMFPMNRWGLDRAIDTLRGRHPQFVDIGGRSW